MATQSPLQWKKFRGNWEDFQRLCAELIEDHGYAVEMRSPGGGDQGRDIEAFEIIELFPVQRRRIAFWVECKSRLAEAPKAVPVDEVAKCIGYAQIEGVPALIFMTNYKLSNDAKDQILRLSQMKNFPLGISYIEEELLDRLILERPRLYRKYFGGRPPLAPAPASQTVECILRVGVARLGNASGAATLSAVNHGFRPIEIDVYDGDAPVGRLALNGFGRAELEILASSVSLETGLAALRLAPEADNVLVQLDRRVRPRPAAPPRLFFDPLSLGERLKARLAAGLDSYILGPGGAGKTSLARAATASLPQTVVRLDASRVEAASPFHRLLVIAFADSGAGTGPLPTAAPTQAGAADQAGEARPDLLGEAALAEAFDRARRHKAGQVLVVDNVHNLREADVAAFRRLLIERPTHALLLIARPAEFKSEAVERLFFGEQGDAEAYVRLDRAVVSRAMGEAIETLAADAATASFLRQFGSTGNFQSFTLLIELLRTSGLLAPDGDSGRYRLAGERPALSLDDYGEILQALLEATRFEGDVETARQVLALASTWGKAFPADLVIFAMGGDGERCVNRLIGIGLLVDAEPGSPADLAFEHELTQEITQRTLSALQARGHHRSILAFLATLGENHRLNSATRRAHHLECAGEGSEAALLLCSHLRARHSELPRPETLALALQGLSLADRFGLGPAMSAREARDSEADLLTWIIELGYLCHGPGWADDFLRRFELLAYADGRPELLGRSDYFWARRHMYQHLPDLALTRAEKSVRELARAGHDPYLTVAINRLGNVQKNLADFAASARTHHRAARVARRAKNRLELARSLREFGATLIEANRVPAAIRWWSTSLAHAEASGDVDEVVQQKANLAYGRALARDSSPGLGLTFEECDAAAQHFGLFGQKAKNLVNWANWLFHERGEAEAGFAKIGEALKLADRLDYEYAKVIARLSYVSFAQCGAGVRRPDFERFLAGFIDEALVATGRLERMADNRFVSLVKFFLSYRPEMISRSIRDTANPALAGFLRGLGKVDLAALEAWNPYFRPSGTWAVYY